MQRVEDLLRAAVVRIEGGPRPGTGFLLAPGRVVTCVHVVGRDAALRLHLDDGTTLPARRVLLACDGGRPIPALDEDYPDVAVLEVDLDGHVCVMLDRDRPAIGDGLQAYGYPSEGDSVLLTPQGLRYEGVKGPEATPFVDVSSTAPIKPGMSGAPLLNVRTGTVCGVLVATRSATSTRGGLAVGWSALGETISSRLLGANRSFHLRDDRWSRALGDRRTRTFFGRVPTVARFTGRGAELETLSRRLAAAGTEPFRQAITGLGGVGKTQLAAQYVHSHRDDYDIVAWVRAQDAGVADLAALAATLGLAVGDLGTEARAERALSWLECCDERWLLVLDDVSDPEQLETCCPSGGNGRVLITSRHRDFEHLGPALAIDVFDDATGAEYLIERTGRRGERKTALALSRALGGLPLALAHAAAYCTREVSFEEYRQMLIALPPRKLFHRSRAEFYRQTVASTWQPSIDAAAGEAPLARDVLAMAAHLAPDRIPRTLFNELLDDRERPLGNMQLVDALAALDRYSLADLGKATLSVPRLLQHVVLNDSVDAQRRREAGHAALQAVSEAMPSDSALPDAWPQCEKLLPHVLAIGESLSLTGEQPSRLLGLLNRGCGYLLDAGQRRRAVDVARRNVVIAHDLLGGEHPDTLRTELQLADALQWEDSTPEALRLARRVLEDCKRLLGDAHRITISARAQVAFSCEWAGHSDEAIRLGEQVLRERAEQRLGEEHELTLTALEQLSWSYLLARRYEKAIAMNERVLAVRMRELGDMHPKTLWSRAAVALAQRDGGQLASAIALFESVAEDRATLLGFEHPDSLWTRANLAKAYERSGDPHRAITLLEPLVRLYEDVLGARHRDTLWALAHLASAYRATEGVEAAIKLGLRVLLEREQVLGPDHPDTLGARGELVRTHLARAIALQAQVIVGSERLLGAEHRDTRSARRALRAMRKAADPDERPQDQDGAG